MALGVGDGEEDVAFLRGGLDDDDELAMEQSHGGLDKRLEGCGIAIAYGLERAAACDIKCELVGGIWDQMAILICQTDGHES